MTAMLWRLNQGHCSFEDLVTAVYGQREPKQYRNMTYIRLTKMRERLEPLGVGILSRRGKGYSLVEGL